jgi:hypothetical protein
MTVPQFGHWTSELRERPHSRQNFQSGGFSLPQFEQSTRPSSVRKALAAYREDLGR